MEKSGEAMKKIAVINDLSGFGRCSLTAAIPIISALGAECCPLPTAVLSNQTGYDSYHCIDLTDELESYIEEWKKLGYTFDAIMTGYIASPRQADLILNFIDDFKTPQTKLIVDPVMADDGRIYGTYSSELCGKIKEIAKRADIITPNLTELCILTNADYEEIIAQKDTEGYFDLIASLAQTLISDSLKTVIVTGIISSQSICNIIAEKESVSVVKSEIFGGSYSGTGDIFASIISAEAAKGTNIEYAVELAAKFLSKAIESSFYEGSDRNDGVNFQEYLEMLTNE